MKKSYKIDVDCANCANKMETAAKQTPGVKDAVVNFNKGADAVQALVTDEVDCVIIDNAPAKSFVEANPGLKILDTEYAVEDYAICVAKDNDELLDKINDALAKLKEDGTLDEIINKYIPSDGE